MRFLVDEALQRRIADFLSDAGHDAIHVADRDLLGATDHRVLRQAREEGRVLVTADTDFGDLLALTGAGAPSVLLVRRPGRSAEARVEAILAAAVSAETRLEAGAIVVVLPDRLRIRDLPISDR